MASRAVVAVLLSSALLAVSPPPAPAPPAAAAVLARLADDPRAPDAYTAALALHVKLRVFPYLGLTLHGTETYRRPGTYRYQLRGLPQIASKFGDLSYDLGDPATWPRRYDIAVAPESSDERPVLRLTTKKRGLVEYLDVAIDPTSGHIVKATWTRYDGGVIVLTQHYVSLEAADVVDAQHATIDIPHMRADLDARYTAITLATPSVSANVPEQP